MKLLTCTLVLYLCQPIWLTGQPIAWDILNTTTDSCSLSIHDVATLEMTKPFEEPFERELIRIKIEGEDWKTLIKKVAKKPSYQNERALLTHHNVTFELYRDGSIFATIQLSTLTGNIVIHSLNTPEAFYNSASRKFARFLVRTLKKYDLLGTIPDDMQRLGKN